MRRGAAYAASGTTLPDQSCESKLSQHIQQLAVCRMLSKEWLKVHISLYLVTNTALLQHKPYKDGDPHTTLWEGNEVAARLVLETGRVNVLLRCCVVPRDELKQHVMDSSISLLEVGAIECGLHNSAEAFAAAVTYTKNLGSLLNVVLSHVEAVQMIDLTLLIRHVSQEHFALLYLWRVAKRFEEVGEDKVMPLLAAEGIIPLVISFLHAYHSSLAREVQMAGCMFLSASFDAEDARKLPQESNAKLREFMPLLLEQLNLGASERRQLRPLFDELRRGG